MFSKLTLEVNGKELNIPIELTDTQIRQIYLAAESKTKLTGWDEPKNGGVYFYEDALGRVQSMLANESSEMQLNILYNSSNCFSSEKVADDIARCDSLIRKIRRRAILSRKNALNFEQNGGYVISYNYKDNCLECGVTGSWKSLGDIVFETEEEAMKVIAEYADELIWYFTKMRDRL